MNGSRDPLRRQRHIPDADPQSMGHGVADCSSGWASGALARPEGWVFRPLDHRNLDSRDLRKFENGIICPGADGKSVLIPSSRLFQGPARGLDDAAFDLIHQTIAVNDKPGVHSSMDREKPHLIRYLNTRNDGAIRSKIFIARKADAAPKTFAAALICIPAGEAECGANDGSAARIAQVIETELDGINTRYRRQFVHEGFDCEDIAV